MRKLLNAWLHPPTTSTLLCQYHQPYTFKNVKASEQCMTCSIDLCYMCSNTHSGQHCTLRWGKPSYFESKTNKAFLFNHGFLAKFYLDNLSCACGSKIKPE